jgi:hypothetical protein
MKVRRIFTLIAVLVLILGSSGPSSWAVQGERAPKQALEQAVGPHDVLTLEEQGRITVRALRAWDRLPSDFLSLAATLRREQGLDLLSADLETIQKWTARAKQGEQGFAAHEQTLQALEDYMQSGEYLDWEPIADPGQVAEGTPVRQGGSRWVHTTKDAQADMRTAALSGDKGAPARGVDVPGSKGATASGATDSGSEQGLEFRITDQTQGIFRASLRLEGLEEARIEEDRYFQVMAQKALPDSPQVHALEQKELTPNARDWTSDRPYQIRAGYARIGQRIAVRVEAPKQPKIVVPDKEAEAGFSYEIVGRKFKVLVSDEAHGDAEVDVEKDWNGEHGGGAAWIEEDPENGKRVVVNGRPGRWYDDIFRYMKFSEQGELFGFRADLGQWELLVINGLEGSVFEDIHRFEITRDGAHYMVAGRVRKGLEKVIIDGHIVRKTAGKIKEAVQAPDGTAAWVEESADSGLVRMMSTNGDTHPVYTAIYSPQFSAQGRVLAYIGRKEDKQRFLVLNGREVHPTMGVNSKYTLTPDGTHYAYVTPNADNTESMVIDGRIGPAYKGIWNPALLSADGSRSLYVAKTEKGEVLVLDEQEFEHSYGEVKKVRSVVFSEDGGQLGSLF